MTLPYINYTRKTKPTYSALEYIEVHALGISEIRFSSLRVREDHLLKTTDSIRRKM